MLHDPEYQVRVNERNHLVCEKCGTPLPLEPESFRRTFPRSEPAESGWFVWRCPNPLCRAKNIRRADDVADIEREFDLICC
jgi:hypothetical protein